jgi:high-affinity iron transporter
MGTEDDQGLFNLAIATIFAREILEGALIIGNYRTCIIKTQRDEALKKQQLRTVTMSAILASIVAVIIIAVVAIALGLLSNELDETAVQIVEGVAKIVGAVAVLQLSLKIPVWLGIYEKISLLPCKKRKPEAKHDGMSLTLAEIRFNVAWNIWREVAECGAFLIPFFLRGSLKAIPLSALVGAVISLVLGLLIYVGNNRMRDKTWLAVTMSGLMLQLSVGLFTMGCNEFELVWGQTKMVWEIQDQFWHDKRLPMTILRPFGYSSSRTVLQICCFWLWLGLGLLLHFIKWRNTKIDRASRQHLRGVAVNSDDVVSTTRFSTADVDDSIQETEHSDEETPATSDRAGAMSVNSALTTRE